MPDDTIKHHSEVMSLLGEKIGLIKMQNKLTSEISKISLKLERLDKKKMFRVLKGDKNKR
tara:strand:+ start:69 stop:248 length:180 start_codon:yes stop_codon:yes gene_type:complete